MTTHYIDITLLPDPEFSHAHLLGALFAKLHRALATLGTGNIGVSFPQYMDAPPTKLTLGHVLRLHGGASALEALMRNPWLQGMRDHVQVTPLLSAPTDAPHRIVQRRQFKTNAERLRRRRMLRKGETMEQAAAAIPSSIERRPDLPFVQLRSNSTGQSFYLYVSHGPFVASPVLGLFNAYGLGPLASIPWF